MKNLELHEKVGIYCFLILITIDYLLYSFYN